jgi:two-component system, OmpR family, heavy metal sensor histidine kinase CusS
MPLTVARRKLNNLRTLRARLTIWNTVVVLIVVLIALYAVREGLRYYLFLETDETLDAEAKELLLAVEVFYATDRAQIIAEMKRKEEAHRQRDWHIRWMDGERRQTLWASNNAPARPLTQFLGTHAGHSVWRSPTHRSVERELNKPGIPLQYVRVGTPTSFVEDDVNRLTRILAPVGLAIFLLAPLGGLLLADRAIEPLQRIIQTTDRLRPSHIDERLVDRGVGDELDQLACKINTFLDQIAEHLQKNRDFVADAAHELRSPLAAIQSLVEVTLERKRSGVEYEELLFQINDECRHLANVVNQLLQLTRSEASAEETRRERVSLDELISKAAEMFGPVAEERQVKLRVEIVEPLTVRGNPREIRQLLTNLIDNAIKFTPSGGTVDVKLDRADDPEIACLTVRDTGIGIPSEFLPRVFDRFFQVDKSRHRGIETRGNGLGLSICLSIVNAHRGKIAVESKMDVGTTFTVCIPIARATAADFSIPDNLPDTA